MSRNRVVGRGVAIFWLLAGQAEEGGEQGRVGLNAQALTGVHGPLSFGLVNASEVADAQGLC